jgi:ribosomal protein S18 acetylase RimI-like enzyme
MKLTMRAFKEEVDFWRVRNFLRELYLLDGLLVHGGHVASLDFWRWHYIMTCQETAPVDEEITIWETNQGRIGAVLHPICHDEIRIAIHPMCYSEELEEKMIAYSEMHHSDWYKDRQRILYVPTLDTDTRRQEILAGRGYSKLTRFERYWMRDLDSTIPKAAVPAGYEIRSMGDAEEHPDRNWASWLVFHPGEPDENFDPDHTWYRNLKAAPLYRRDLDLVAIAPGGGIAAFCTIWYDDYTRSAQVVFIGTVPEHQGHGLGKAIMCEGMKRLKQLGSTSVFTIAGADPAENAFCESVLQDYITAEQWVKTWTP